MKDNLYAQISKKIEEIEKLSAAEIVFVVKNKSSNYFLHSSVYSFIITMFFLFLILETELFFASYIAVFICVFLFSLLLILTYYFDIYNFFIPNQTKKTSAQEKAGYFFYKYDVYKTKNRIGLLIYISLCENIACLLADTGIKNAIHENEWNKLIYMFNKSKKSPEALLYNLDNIAKILIEKLPVQEGKINEIKNIPEKE